jgi:hypothetical protein
MVPALSSLAGPRFIERSITKKEKIGRFRARELAIDSGAGGRAIEGEVSEDRRKEDGPKESRASWDMVN